MTGRAFRVSGRVQGVGFRWWTVGTARRLGVTGRVRNEAGGTVLVEAWGEPASIEQLEQRLWQGPSGARVDAVEPLGPPTPAPAPPSDFSID